ncbi:1-deoxy-D-xylulose-5-phosphate synthase [uncultured Clostridium sp.]|uniref:transketolase family protein n=1 Tax=Enterocloster citroniae TaxID=358743 RepID=UPI0008210540|nr:1-deoxy-D-xylulose-5-phosphate synthase [uncultured Clostridium sp.]
MNKVANRQVICQVLCEEAKKDRDIVVLCSDSRGSASLAPFAKEYPNQFVETGIAEQDLVGIAAGLARSGKKSFAASPACFLSTRSLEQAKVDVAYSNTNVKLIGISGGISYGALGMSHHSAQDIAGMASIPNMRVYLPSDRHQTACLVKALLKDEKPAYIRVGRNAVEDVYEEGKVPFVMDRANVLNRQEQGADVLIVACGEMVRPSLDAVSCLAEEGIRAEVIDMYCVKPLDTSTLLKEAGKARAVVTVEEHSPFGGLGSMVSQAVAGHCPKKVINLSLPDSPVVSGTSREVFDYYGLNAAGITAAAKEALER